MEDLLALFDNDIALLAEVGFGDGCLGVCHLLVVDRNAALFNQSAGFAVGLAELAAHHQVENADRAVGEVGRFKLRGGHVFAVAACGKNRLGSRHRLVGFLLTVNELGQLIGENLLGAVELAAFPAAHFVDFLQRQEGQHADAFQHVRVVHVAPVLEEVVGGSLLRVEPHRALGGLAHLLALGIEQQGNGHGVGVLAELAADQLRAAEHIRPLVVAAELQVAAVFLKEMQEIVALHDHVVKFQEAESLLHTLLVALGTEHVVDREAGSDVSQQFDVIQLEQPVAVVDEQCLALSEVDEFAHLLLEALDVVVDCLGSHHLSEIGSPGWIADHSRAAADKRNRLVASHLQPLHQTERHEVPHMQRIGSRVKTDVEGSLAVVDKLFDFLFVCHLRN